MVWFVPTDRELQESSMACNRRLKSQQVLVLISCAFAASAVLLSGCQLARMQVSPALTSVPPLPVEQKTLRRWDDPVRFGAWYTANVDEGWIRIHGWRLAWFESSSRVKPYRFALTGGVDLIQVQCLTSSQLSKFHESDSSYVAVDVRGLRKMPKLSCAYADSNADDGTLKLLSTPSLKDEAAESGQFEFGTDRWDVASVTRFEGGRYPGEVAGYEIRRGNEAVGAVEIINGGRVWISPALASHDQDRVAAIAATLLLYQPLDELPTED
jgi:hypothetical protein